MQKQKIKIYCGCCGKQQPIKLIFQHNGKHTVTCKHGHVVGEYHEYTLRKVRGY